MHRFQIKRPLTLLVILFICSASLSQNTRTTIHFKDGQELKGWGKVLTKNRIKFKENLNDKSIKYSFEGIDYVEMNNYGVITTYKLVKLKGRRLGSTVLQVVHEGRISLYKSTSQGVYASHPGTGFGSGSAGMAGGSFYSIDNYYVMKEDENEASLLSSTQVIGRRSFKKGASAYFEDCPLLVEKIQEREFKKRDIEEIIEYYNSHCD